MKKLLCALFGHRPQVHLAWIYGTLPREEHTCTRCSHTIYFQRPSEKRLEELRRDEKIEMCDGAVGGCKIFV